MISYDKWLAWEKISFLNGGFFRGIAAMGVGYLLAQLPPPATQDSVRKISSISFKNVFYTLFECIVLIYTVGCMFVKSWYISPFFIFICSAILVSLFIQKKGFLSTLTNHPLFFKPGKFTLPIYLLQQTPIAIFGAVFFTYKEQMMRFPCLTIILTLSAVCLWGICGYYFVKEISGYMHQFLNDRNS